MCSICKTVNNEYEMNARTGYCQYCPHGTPQNHKVCWVPVKLSSSVINRATVWSSPQSSHLRAAMGENL